MRIGRLTKLQVQFAITLHSFAPPPYFLQSTTGEKRDSVKRKDSGKICRSFVVGTRSPLFGERASELITLTDRYLSGYRYAEGLGSCGQVCYCAASYLLSRYITWRPRHYLTLVSRG